MPKDNDEFSENTKVTKPKKAVKKENSKGGVSFVVSIALMAALLVGLTVAIAVIFMQIKSNGVSKMQITALQKENQTLKKEINDTKVQAESYDKIIAFLRSKTAGKASGKFYASDKIIIISKASGAKTFTVTSKFNKSIKVEMKYNSSNVIVSAKSKANKMTIIVTPVNPGISTIDFSNNKNSQKFEVLVIVVD